MDLSFKDKRITGILTVLPENTVRFEEEMGNYSFPVDKSLRLARTMGYNEKRILKTGCVSDMCVRGVTYLTETGLLNKEDIDALILITQSPDYFMPPTSNIIHGRLQLKQDMICMDINQGCAGYIIGLFQAFMLLEQENINKVVLLNADILSRKVSKWDRNSNPIVGDAASVTIIEKTEGEVIHGNIKTDGTRADALMIPAGGFAYPVSDITRQLNDDLGNIRSPEHLVMKGDAVFNFVMEEVPKMIANLNTKDVDFYVFHQPNRFMLNRLADKMDIPYWQMPSNVVENFGNSSGTTIPVTLTHNLSDRLLGEKLRICLAGFGVGLTWGSMIINIGNLKFCKTICI